MRIFLKDKPGVLAKIASVLGRQGISIASVIQKEAGSSDGVPVVIVTHPAKEKRFEAALKQIQAMKVVRPGMIRLRIEDVADSSASG